MSDENQNMTSALVARAESRLPARRLKRIVVPQGVQIGSRFEPVVTTPRQLHEMMVYDADTIRGMSYGSDTYRLSGRFFKTLALRLGVQTGIFGLFSPAEVMERAAQLNPDLPLRMTVDTEAKEVLGLSPNKGLPVPVRFIENVLHADRRLQEVSYQEGMMEASLDLDEQWDVPNDSKYHVRVRCRIPVDGIGMPDMTLSTWRLVCSNGAVAEGPMFRTRMEIKDNSGDHFRRLLASFSNPSGVEMLQHKMMTAAETKASVGEVLFLEGLLRRAVANSRNLMLLRERLNEMAGNPCITYGVTALENIGQKKRPLLPVSCSVSDLLNFASELQTHHRDLLKDDGLLQAFPGTVLSKGFDLEDLGYVSTHPKAAFHLDGLQFVKEAV